MSRWLTPRMAALSPYVPGEHVETGDIIRLNSNESPYPPSPGVRAAMADTLQSLNFYNDPDCAALRGAIAALAGVRPENVMAGNGSDQVIFLALMAFAGEQRTVALPDVTYSYYDDFMAALGIAGLRRPLDADFRLNPDDYLSPGVMTVFPNPNAPTGLAVPLDDIRRIAKADEERVVLVDEAYVDFGAESAVPLIWECPNLLITRTFSKSGSLAGARLGYALGSEALIGELMRVRSATDLYGVSRMAQAAGIAACREWDYYAGNCARIEESRAWTADRLRALGWETTESLANFLFVRPKADAGRVARALADRGILVRHWAKPRVADWLRISVGTRQDMERLCEAARELTEEGIV